MIEPNFGASVLLVNGLIEVLKLVKIVKLERFYPLIAEVLGFGIGFGIGLGWFESLFVGLAAMGLYDVALKPAKERLIK